MCHELNKWVPVLRWGNAGSTRQVECLGMPSEVGLAGEGRRARVKRCPSPPEPTPPPLIPYTLLIPPPRPVSSVPCLSASRHSRDPGVSPGQRQGLDSACLGQRHLAGPEAALPVLESHSLSLAQHTLMRCCQGMGCAGRIPSPLSQ